MTRTKARMGELVACLLFVLMYGCDGSPIATARSPDEKKEVRVYGQYVPFLDAGVSIELMSDGKVAASFTDAQDRKPAAVQIVWNDDSSLFEVVEFDEFTSNLTFAYDVQKNQRVSPTTLIPLVNRTLIKRYRLEKLASDKSFDPKEWVSQQIEKGNLPSR